jgi:hypothetical protein
MNKFPQMSALVPRLRRASKTVSGKAVEEALREIQDEAEGYPERYSHLMALEFYLAEILDGPITQWTSSVGGATNYVELLDQIKRSFVNPPLLFVNFNYDRMLENAISELLMFDIKNDLTEYITDAFRVIKPHGSVDWAYAISESFHFLEPTMPMATSVIRQSTDPDIRRGPLIMKSQLTKYATGRGGHLMLWRPAIAIPLDQGKAFVCPESHLLQLKSDLQMVTSLLIVGWRATEQHFLKVLAECLPKNRPIKLCIVDKGDGGDATQRNLEQALGPEINFWPKELHVDGFSDFVSSATVQDWLKYPLKSA